VGVSVCPSDGEKMQLLSWQMHVPGSCGSTPVRLHIIAAPMQAPYALQVPDLMHTSSSWQGAPTRATAASWQVVGRRPGGKAGEATHTHRMHVSEIGSAAQFRCCISSAVHSPNAKALCAWRAASTAARTRSAGSRKRPSFPDYGRCASSLVVLLN
jgi:hypothetical protein